MEHPLIGSLADLSIEELTEKISSLHKAQSYASRNGNYTMVNQVQMVLTSYRNEMGKRQAEMFKDSTGDIKGKIDIS
jgi:uncharacterized membrane protein (DUF106 family)